MGGRVGPCAGGLAASVRSLSRRKVGAFLFFFSSRRRHTRFDCDWSSDVCSSDLMDEAQQRRLAGTTRAGQEIEAATLQLERHVGQDWGAGVVTLPDMFEADHQIGRASCRERV